MTIQRCLFLAVLTLSLCVASSASAQRGGGGFFGGGQPLVRLSVNEAVQKELGLSGEVTTKLTALNEEFTAASQKALQDAGLDFGNFGKMSEAERQNLAAKMTEVNTKVQGEINTKLKAIVSADQYKRLGEIQLQANLLNQGPLALTATAIATELKLTDEQKEKLTDLATEYAAKQRELRMGGTVDAEAMNKLREEQTTKTVEVLAAEQKTKLETLKGKAFDVSTFGVRGGRGGRGRTN